MLVDNRDHRLKDMHICVPSEHVARNPGTPYRPRGGGGVRAFFSSGDVHDMLNFIQLDLLPPTPVAPRACGPCL